MGIFNNWSEKKLKRVSNKRFLRYVRKNTEVSRNFREHYPYYPYTVTVPKELRAELMRRHLLHHLPLEIAQPTETSFGEWISDTKLIIGRYLVTKLYDFAMELGNKLYKRKVS